MRSNDSFNFPLGLIKYIVVVMSWSKAEVRELDKEYRRKAKLANTHTQTKWRKPSKQVIQKTMQGLGG